MRITLKPDDEIFLCPKEGRTKAFAHVGIVEDRLVVVHDPYRAYCVRYLAPFKYGMAVTTVPLLEQKVGVEINIQCYGLDRIRMFDIVAINYTDQTVTIDIQDSVTVEPRLSTDAPIGDGLKTD
jgi:hypothetical protein